MAGSKRLNNVPHGLLGTFASRNNDINVYWGIGVLKQYAVKYDQPTLIFDLLARNPSWSVDSLVQIAEKTYQKWLIDRLAKMGVDRKYLQSVEIHLRFSTFNEFPNATRDTWGEPYLCSAILTNKEGVVYSASKIGVCAPHDPKKEFRSGRVD